MADNHNRQTNTESGDQKKSLNFLGQLKKHSEFISVMVVYALVTGIIVILLNKIIALSLSIIVFVYIVILATFITMILRKYLYYHLDNSDTKKEVLNKLAVPFGEASQSLESVNTYALIDEFYAKAEFDFFGFKLLCNKWDYFCRILPNLLIAFGLLGTFWGITYNLSGIVEVLNASKSAEMLSLESLQVPLKSMGIAFTSSLVALFCSVLITFANFFWNTKLAKNKLFSHIENQLDNVAMKDAQGETRLSRAVNKMAKEHENFLTRFHQEVSSAIKSSFEGVANKIALENQKANSLATQVYTSFSASATTISGAATIFNSSTSTFSEEVKNLVQSAQEVKDANKNFSKTLTSFNQSLTLLKGYTKEFHEIISCLSNLSEEIKRLNQSSKELLEANQDKINHEITLFNEFSNQTATLLTNFEQTQSKLDGTLETVGEKVSQSVEDNRSLQQSILTEFQQRTIHLAELLGTQIEILQQSLANSFGDQSNQLQSLIDTALTQIGQHSQSIVTLLNDIQYNQTQNNEELKSMNLASSNLANLLTEDSNKTLTALNALQLRMAQLSDTNQAQTGSILNNLSTQIQNYQNTLRQTLTQIAQTGEKSQANLENLKKLDQTLENLTAIRSEMTKLNKLIETQGKNSNLSPDLINLIKTLKRR
jgi:hypothetical protein